MATTDPKRAALVRALMERDLYEMLSIPRDADEAQIRVALATRTEWVEETPMRAAARDAEMHWLAWSERALINDPEIRADYDGALDRKDAAAVRAVESRQRVRKLHVARDQLAKQESQRVVLQEAEKPKAPAPRKKKASTKKVDAADTQQDVLQATQVTDVEEALRGLGETDRAMALLRRAIEADPLRSDARISLINALRDSGNLQGAETAGRTAVEEVPANGGIQYAFGRVLMDLGLLDEAEGVMQAAQENGTPEAAAALQEMKDTNAADGDVEAVERVEEISYPEASSPATNDPAVAEPGIAPPMEADPQVQAD